MASTSNKKSSQHFNKLVWLGVALGVVGLFAIYFIVHGYFQDQNLAQNRQEWKERDMSLKELEAKSAEWVAVIKETVGEGVCRVDAHCRVRGLGAVLCDHHVNYIVYSVLDVKQPEFDQAVRAFNRLADHINRQSYKVLSCGKPGKKAQCIHNRCTVPNVSP